MMMVLMLHNVIQLKMTELFVFFEVAHNDEDHDYNDEEE